MKTYFLFFALFIQFSTSFAQDLEDTVYNFPVPIFTNSNHSLLVLESAWDQMPNLGDEWAVIDTEGQIVGTSPIYLGHNGMAVWGDSPKTKIKDGLYANERFSIVHWNKKEDTYEVYEQFSIQRGSVTYLKDGFTIVNSLGMPRSFDRPKQVYYHLKSVLSDVHIFSYYADAPGDYKLELTYGGVMLFKRQDLFCTRGYYSYDYDKELSPGIYTLNLYWNNKIVASKKIVIDNK